MAVSGAYFKCVLQTIVCLEPKFVSVKTIGSRQFVICDSVCESHFAIVRALKVNTDKFESYCISSCGESISITNDNVETQVIDLSIFEYTFKRIGLPSRCLKNCSDENYLVSEIISGNGSYKYCVSQCLMSDGYLTVDESGKVVSGVCLPKCNAPKFYYESLNAENLSVYYCLDSCNIGNRQLN